MQSSQDIVKRKGSFNDFDGSSRGTNNLLSGFVEEIRMTRKDHKDISDSYHDLEFKGMDARETFLFDQN